MTDLIPGRATPEGTDAYARAHPVSTGHYRSAGDLTVSSVGMGSYLGEVGEAENRGYQQSALACLTGGINVLDTASNYRDQQSERDVGRAIRDYLDGGGERSHFLVSSKAGFLHGDASGSDTQNFLESEYLTPGLFERRDVASNCHVMTPAYVRHELQRSRRNLGLETIDVYFLHNPETQLGAGRDEEEFYDQARDVFAVLEEACEAGHIKVYGAATWTGLRMDPDHAEHLSLLKLVHAAGEAHQEVTGGRASGHRFRAIQLPVNLAMMEAMEEPSQPWKTGQQPALACAEELGLYTMGSAALAQGHMAGEVDEGLMEEFGTEDDMETCLQFARSVPGLHTALVGMGDPAHAAQNLQWCRKQGPKHTI